MDEDILSGPRPEQRSKYDVNRGQRRGQKRHLPAEQAEARVDVGGEGVEELVDDAGIHRWPRLVKHLDGLGLIARLGLEERRELVRALFLVRGCRRAGEGPGAAIGCLQGDEIGKLL